MSGGPHHATAPEDRIPFHLKLVYGLGAFVNNTLAAAMGNMIIVLNLGFGLSPTVVGLLGALPRLTDAITDPLMGYISDKTRSRWGRRRPYIFAGAILAGIVFVALWQLPEGRSDSFYFWYFLGGSLIFYLAYTMFATPWVALGYELTPDYHERTRLMGVQNFIGNIAYMVSPYFLAIMYNERLFDDVKDGASGLAVVIAVVVIGLGILPAIFLRERFQGHAESLDEAGPEATADVRAELAALSDSAFEERLLREACGCEADYYTPQAIAAGKTQFNWSAFFLSGLWLIYRRLWLALLVFVPAAVAFRVALVWIQDEVLRQSDAGAGYAFTINVTVLVLSLLPV